MSQEQTERKHTLREEARKAKTRIKSGFWTDCKGAGAGLEREQGRALFYGAGGGANRREKGRRFLSARQRNALNARGSERRNRTAHRPRILRHAFLRRETAVHAFAQSAVSARVGAFPRRVRV